MSRNTSVLALSAGLVALGCLSTGYEEPAPAPAAVEAAAQAKDDAEDPAKELAEKRRELELARLRLRLVEFDSETEAFEARLALEHARRDADTARRAHEHFSGTEGPHRLAEARLSLDRARYRAEEAEAELIELERMYAEEEFAEITKELVLQRGRRQLEMARRELELSERRLAMLEEFELPKEGSALEQKLLKAREGVEVAERKVRHLALESECELLEARNEVEAAEEEVDELES